MITTTENSSNSCRAKCIQIARLKRVHLRFVGDYFTAYSMAQNDKMDALDLFQKRREPLESNVIHHAVERLREPPTMTAILGHIRRNHGVANSFRKHVDLVR